MKTLLRLSLMIITVSHREEVALVIGLLGPVEEHPAHSGVAAVPCKGGVTPGQQQTVDAIEYLK